MYSVECDKLNDDQKSYLQFPRPPLGVLIDQMQMCFYILTFTMAPKQRGKSKTKQNIIPYIISVCKNEVK